MNRRDFEIASEKLSVIEDPHRALAEAYEQDDWTMFIIHYCRLYIAHGAPFGYSEMAMLIWQVCRQATTDC